MNVTYLVFFAIILIGTLVITHWAAARSRTTHQFYVVSGSLTGFQNGLAIAGDYISSASFLGITGLIAFYGYDGFFYMQRVFSFRMWCCFFGWQSLFSVLEPTQLQM